MADGYEVIVKINLPPEKQYHSGHSVIVQGHTVEEVEKHLDVLAGHEGNGKVILARFGEYALQEGVKAVLSKDGGAEGEAAAGSAKAPSGPASTEKPASAGLLKLVAKKTGKSVDELGELTDEQARSLLKEAS